LVGENEVVPENKIADVDEYINQSVFDDFCSTSSITHVGKHSTKVKIGGRKVDVINIDEMRKNWIESINELIEKLGNGMSFWIY
jgi:hypothetical protein